MPSLNCRHDDLIDVTLKPVLYDEEDRLKNERKLQHSYEMLTFSQ